MYETPITPTKAAITASKVRRPRRCNPRITKVQMPVMTAAGKSAIPKSRWNPSAAPRNSARSVAIAISSACTQRPRDVLRENWSRQTSGRLRPVAIPSFAESVWISIAIRFETRITQQSV